MFPSCHLSFSLFRLSITSIWIHARKVNCVEQWIFNIEQQQEQPQKKCLYWWWWAHADTAQRKTNLYFILLHLYAIQFDNKTAFIDKFSLEIMQTAIANTKLFFCLFCFQNNSKSTLNAANAYVVAALTPVSGSSTGDRESNQINGCWFKRNENGLANVLHPKVCRSENRLLLFYRNHFFH